MCRVVLVAALAAATGCAHRPPMVVKLVAASCHRVVPDRERAVTWVAPGDARDLERLVEWCRTVGPVLVESPEDVSPPGVVESLAIVTWNVHVGGGDIEDVVARLRRGEFTEGRSVPHFVLLLQEAHREGSDVPAGVPAGSPVPRPIVERPPSGERRDIRSLARSERLHVLYAPAMRNGTTAVEDVPEDRGTAILSTLPLANLQVIELPFERQRRVALAASVAGETLSGAPWQLRLADAHFDTSLALTRGGPFVARRRQAEALVEALESGPDLIRSGLPPMVVGGDFNTWLGRKEPALEVLRRAFAETPRAGNTSTWRGPLGARAALDHVFVRGRLRSVTTRRLPGRFGSDHYPLLTVVVF